MQENLPKIKNFDQKKRLIEHLKSKRYDNFNNELAKMTLFGVEGENYKVYVKYYSEYQCITNKIE